MWILSLTGIINLGRPAAKKVKEEADIATPASLKTEEEDEDGTVSGEI